jgi:two-component system nitrogen regulation sensor histidine kinase NtrY
LWPGIYVGIFQRSQVFVVQAANNTNRKKIFFIFNPTYALYDSMNRVNKLITETKIQNQRNEQYYKALIQQSATGLIAMGQLNNIEIANDIACELVGIMVPVNFRKLEIKNSGLWTILCNLKPGQTETYKILRDRTYLHLLIRATALRFSDRDIKLISIQDIKFELDARETESWQKLISILTHEIKNSIAPITSLTTTLIRFFKIDAHAVDAGGINEQVINNTIQGLEIIGERVNGLMNFVSSYRRLTKVPAPVFIPFSAVEWLNCIKILLFDKLEDNQIVFDMHIDKHIEVINGDDKLLTQVLFNLIYNAFDALSVIQENGRIKILIEQNMQKQLQITVANNGAKVADEIQDKIFVLFFTTKENGSRIGLSLSRQIVQLHRGYIYLESDEKLTKFVIVL